MPLPDDLSLRSVVLHAVVNFLHGKGCRLELFATEQGRPLYPVRPTLMVTDGRVIVGYGWLRPDADAPKVADAILAEAFRRLPDREELTANIPISNRRGVKWLRGLGVETEPWDGRMARGASVPRHENAIYGNTVGALG